MKVPFKPIGLSVFVLSSVLCGCGDKLPKSDSKEKSKTESGTESQNQSEAVISPPSAPALKVKTSEMAIQGRKLIMGIIQANIDRQGKADPVWPKAAVDAEGGNDADISERSFKSAIDYFNALFDMENYGKSEWSPHVEGDLTGMLGKNAVVGTTIPAAGLDWCIAANLNDGMPDFMPVLISANFNPALLLRKWDGRTDGEKPLPVGPASGAPKSMFGDQAIVVVRKGGAVEVIKAKSLTYDVLYKKQAFDLTNMKPPFKYLTPTGVVEPIGYK